MSISIHCQAGDVIGWHDIEGLVYGTALRLTLKASWLCHPVRVCMIKGHLCGDMPDTALMWRLTQLPERGWMHLRTRLDNVITSLVGRPKYPHPCNKVISIWGDQRTGVMIATHWTHSGKCIDQFNYGLTILYFDYHKQPNKWQFCV